jgi:hypothetical protein
MHHQDLDHEIDDRLTAMVARAPGRDDPPRPATSTRRRRRLGLSLTTAPVLVLAFVATATAGALVARNLAEGHEGIENPGQALAGARMECMAPPEAARFLAEHGFSDVVWQVETGDIATKTGGTTVQVSVPPAHGYVIPGSILDDGKLVMLVDQRVGSTAVGACFGIPMP